MTVWRCGRNAGIDQIMFRLTMVMRQMLRWAFNGAAVVSAVLFAAVVVLWVRSHAVCDRFYWGEKWEGHSGDGGVMTTVGIVEFWHRTFVAPCDPELRHSKFMHDTYSPAADMNWLTDQGAMPVRHLFGFSAERQHVVRPSWGSGQGVWDDISLTFPFWFVAAATLLLPHCFVDLAFRRWVRARLRGGFICSRCGYDLRATPDRCPECGTIPNTKHEEG